MCSAVARTSVAVSTPGTPGTPQRRTVVIRERSAVAAGPTGWGWPLLTEPAR